MLYLKSVIMSFSSHLSATVYSIPLKVLGSIIGLTIDDNFRVKTIENVWIPPFEYHVQIEST